MMNTQELKTTVSKLTPDQLLKFAEWFEWDKKIETDIVAGRLDTLGEYADSEFVAGRAKPL